MIESIIVRRKIRLWMTSGVWRNHCRMDRPVYVSLAEIGTHFSTWKAIGVTSRRLYMTSITAFQVTEATASTILVPASGLRRGLARSPDPRRVRPPGETPATDPPQPRGPAGDANPKLLGVGSP